MFLSDGAKQWSYVELAIARPWFCATIRVEEDGFGRGRILHLSDYRHLVDIKETVGDALEAVEVALPSHYTGKDGWTMLPLRAIWGGTAPDGTTASVYVSPAGRRYSSYEGGLHERDLENRQLLFRWRPRRPR